MEEYIVTIQVMRKLCNRCNQVSSKLGFQSAPIQGNFALSALKGNAHFHYDSLKHGFSNPTSDYKVLEVPGTGIFCFLNQNAMESTDRATVMMNKRGNSLSDRPHEM